MGRRGPLHVAAGVLLVPCVAKQLTLFHSIVGCWYRDIASPHMRRVAEYVDNSELD